MTGFRVEGFRAFGPGLMFPYVMRVLRALGLVLPSVHVVA